ncbi:PadR family transcriptional regulator [Patulibacter defluvii]|uniref:PadR family transcriptional regulator n=1 Tax=Patulibacter defluvii TaxID=3095358 RepID=UPI002A766276|nr:helix-turn-helix transcriptional regulator [Patulibacter sp. DM4]
MTLPLKSAVLGLLAREPSYSHRLHEQLRALAEDPDAVPRSSLYHAIRGLEEDGLIEERAPDPSASPHERRRRFYRATDEGHAELERFLTGAPTSHDDLRVRLAVSRPQDLPLLIHAVRNAEAATLRRLEQLRRRSAGSGPDRWFMVCEMLLANHDAGELESRVERLREMRIVLEKLRTDPNWRSG